MSRSSAPVPEDQTDALIELVRWKVHRFHSAAKPVRFPNDELDDVVHDVLVDVLRKLPQFDAARASLGTFVARIAETALLEKVRHDSAARRNPMREPERNSAETGGLLGTRRRNAVPFPEPTTAERSAGDHRDLMLDLAEAIAALPPHEQHLAEDLRELNPAEIAERDGVHRGTIYRRLASIRRRWEDGTLRDYLES